MQGSSSGVLQQDHLLIVWQRRAFRLNLCRPLFSARNESDPFVHGNDLRVARYYVQHRNITATGKFA